MIVRMHAMQTIVVTGAGGGLGVGLVNDLLDRKFKVISQYRSESEKLREVYHKHNHNPDLWCFKLELTHEHSVDAFSNRVTNSGCLWGPIDGVVNLAGASTNGMSWKLSTDDFMSVIRDNLLTTFIVSKAFIPHMRFQGHGRIINTSSVVAFSGVPGASHYCAAKAGIVGLSKSMSLELANKGITVNTLALGYFDAGLIDDVDPKLQEAIKEKTPVKRFGTAKEIGEVVAYLMSDGAAFVTGQVLHVNGGIL